jgi:murein DD-endopeptidase MepM/ murein hydrolase activator NlpD
MTKFSFKKLIYARLAIITGLSLIATGTVWLEAEAKNELGDKIVIAMGKNNYLDLKTYDTETPEPEKPQVIFTKPQPEECTPLNNCLEHQKPVTPPPQTIKSASLDTEIAFPLLTPGNITSPFGWRSNPLTGVPHLHEGVDFAVPIGTPILAVKDGEVAIAGTVNGYGFTVILRHNQNSKESLYAHLSKVLVKPGQKIKQGTVIGLSGNTGMSTGPHLHFEWRELNQGNWIATDPGNILMQARAKMIKAQIEQQKPPELKLAFKPEEYSRAPRGEKSLLTSNFPLNLAIKIPDKVTNLLRRRLFGLPDHFLGENSRDLG